MIIKNISKNNLENYFNAVYFRVLSGFPYSPQRALKATESLFCSLCSSVISVVRFFITSELLFFSPQRAQRITGLFSFLRVTPCSTWVMLTSKFIVFINLSGVLKITSSLKH